MSAADLAHPADSPARKIPIAQFHQELKAQGTRNGLNAAFVCPMCKTLQSGRSFILAGAGKTFEDVAGIVGFKCVGRYTKAGPHKPNTVHENGCDWTLGGLFRIHSLEITTEDGKPHPHFELATTEAALRLQAKYDAVGVEQEEAACAS